MRQIALVIALLMANQVQAEEVITESSADSIYLNRCQIVDYDLRHVDTFYTRGSTLYVRAGFYVVCRNFQDPHGGLESGYYYGRAPFLNAEFRADSWYIDGQKIATKTSGFRRAQLSSPLEVKIYHTDRFNSIDWSAELISP